MKLSVSLLATAGLFAGFTGSASAHITLKVPKARTTVAGQKGPPPCGTLGAANPQKFKAGETIMVEFEETVPHVGRFRIAFDDEGTDFPNPMTKKDTNATLPLFMDGLVEKAAAGRGATHRIPITFPNKPTAKGTLQVIQVMKVNPPYNVNADGDIYYQCADIVLEGEAGPADGGAPADAGGTGGAGATGGAGGASTGGAGGAATGGTAGSTGGTGGSPTSTGGSGGGSSNTGGTGGSTTGGASGSTGGSGGGSSSMGGRSGTGGAAPAPSGGGESSAGGCSMGGTPASGGLFALSVIGAALVARARRRRS